MFTSNDDMRKAIDTTPHVLRGMQRAQMEHSAKDSEGAMTKKLIHYRTCDPYQDVMYFLDQIVALDFEHFKQVGFITGTLGFGITIILTGDKGNTTMRWQLPMIARDGDAHRYRKFVANYEGDED